MRWAWKVQNIIRTTKYLVLVSKTTCFWVRLMWKRSHCISFSSNARTLWTNVPWTTPGHVHFLFSSYEAICTSSGGPGVKTPEAGTEQRNFEMLVNDTFIYLEHQYLSNCRVRGWSELFYYTIDTRGTVRRAFWVFGAYYQRYSDEAKTSHDRNTRVMGIIRPHRYRFPNMCFPVKFPKWWGLLQLETCGDWVEFVLEIRVFEFENILKGADWSWCIFALSTTAMILNKHLAMLPSSGVRGDQYHG